MIKNIRKKVKKAKSTDHGLRLINKFVFEIFIQLMIKNQYF